MKNALLFAMAASLLTMAGCTMATYPIGVFYTGTIQPNSEVDKAELGGGVKAGDKTGEACATGILGLVAWGDASVAAAKKAAAIIEVHSVEYSPTVAGLGAYFRACTVVHGK